MGTLRIHGVIDISQFWPQGSSDADTTKIKLKVGPGSFEYRENNSKKFVKTDAFQDAISKGQGAKPVINTSKRTGEQTITIRLQGVDAPELHYKAAPLRRVPTVTDAQRAKFNEYNAERRQCFAESSTVALAKYLKAYANDDGMIPAVVQTAVEKPFEAVDTYGRFVANIAVGKKFDKDLNVWLVENGWGMPTFYTSMTLAEMDVFLRAWKKGKVKAGRVGKSVLKDASRFDWKLLYREPSEDIYFKMGEDRGRVLVPKLFRRQCSWMVSRKAGVLEAGTSFQDFLKTSPDQLVLLEDLREQGIHAATVFALHDFVDRKNRVLKGPEEIVFKEKPGTLVDSKGKLVDTL